MSAARGSLRFLCKNVGIDALPRALHCAKNGEAVITRRLTMRLIEDLRLVRTDSAGLRPIRSQLTSREWEVLDLPRQDLSTDEIADRLVVSVETVRSHVMNVLRKLEVRSRRDAVAAASRLRAGMLEDGLRRRNDAGGACAAATSQEGLEAFAAPAALSSVRPSRSCVGPPPCWRHNTARWAAAGRTRCGPQRRRRPSPALCR